MSRVHELARLDRTGLIAAWMSLCNPAEEKMRYALAGKSGIPWDRDRLIAAIMNTADPLIYEPADDLWYDPDFPDRLRPLLDPVYR